jgi:tetratricopeptide (TPR) repeat protein
MKLDEGLRAKQMGNLEDAISYYKEGLELSWMMFKNQAHYELSKLYYETGDYTNAIIVSDEIKIMTHQTSRQFYYAKYFLYSGLANLKLKNYRLAKSNLEIFLKIYEPASENLKYKKMAREAIADMKKLRS